MPAIELQRLHHVGGRKMRGKGKGQAEFGGKFRAEETGTEEPDGHAEACTRNGANFLIWTRRLEIGLQLFHVLREVVGGGSCVAPQGACGGLVRSRSAAEAEIDAVGIERGECA